MTDETGPERTPGPVEAGYRTWVTTLGALSPRQAAEAAQMFRLAAEMDLFTDRPASALGTLSRAIARTADRLRDEKNAGGKATGPTPANVVPETAWDAARAARAARRSGGTA